MATYERLDYGSPDGSQWGGTSSDALAFYGETPVTRYATALAASTYLVSTATTATTGYISAVQLSSFISNVSSVIRALQRYGLTTST